MTVTAFLLSMIITSNWQLKRIENLFQGSEENDQMERKKENEKRREERRVRASLSYFFGKLILLITNTEYVGIDDILCACSHYNCL